MTCRPGAAALMLSLLRPLFIVWPAPLWLQPLFYSFHSILVDFLSLFDPFFKVFIIQIPLQSLLAIQCLYDSLVNSLIAKQKSALQYEFY